MTADLHDAGAMDRCPDCGGVFAPSDGPTHAYLGASTGCWAAFNDVLAREFQDAGYFAAHRYTTDAYTVQHPGDQSDRRAAQSVNIHLAALCALLEENWDKASVGRLLGTLANNHKDKFEPLTPPAPERYNVRVTDVLEAKNAIEHGEITRAWAQDVWDAWEAHHDVARRLIRLVSG